MPFPQVLEVAIGLILIYYILGALVSIFTQAVLESLETRGVALERYLKLLAGDMAIEIKDLPQIRVLRPIRYVHWWNVFGADTKPKRLERIPVETLVDAFFDLTGLTAQGSLNARELTTLIGKLPESDGKQALLGWVTQGVTAINDLRERTSAYFGGMLSQAAQTFRAKARSIVIIASVVVTLLFGTDTIQLAHELWTNAGLRTIAINQAQAVTSQPEDAATPGALLTDLGALSFRIGWWTDVNAPGARTPGEWLHYVFYKLLGLAITSVAVSQGSSFWYDLLKKLTGGGGSG
ncbi:MAG TPA: hypothetical protein VFH29_06640, partial [Anaerolineales bacterium]|nr:hypothetical protein [Anaerolineales bacterium]